MWKEFRAFVARGNVTDMAVGIIIGASFGAIARSLVDDLLMPPLGLLLGNVDFQDLFVILRPGMEPGPYLTVAQAQEAGAVTLNYGLFINSVVSFLLVAVAMFFVVQFVNRLRREEEPAPPSTQTCPYCRTSIPVEASRCPYCTSHLGSS